MKIIAAMKQVKSNKEKITDLSARIANSSANLSNETPVYGAETATKIKEWLQAIHDLGKENIKLLVSIQRTNLAIQVTITIGGNAITKSIAEWVWRRREYAELDMRSWMGLTDRRLKEQTLVTSTGTVDVKLVRHFDPSTRDDKVSEYRSEPHEIDAALEVINATTDLIEA